MINLYPIEVPASMKDRCEARIGDGMNMEFADGEFDIVFSNSVIEHLSTWDNQVRMAREMRRVGKQYYVQTPAREFFFEPHLLTPFVHWLPKALQRRLYRHATVWGLMTRPSPERVEEYLNELRLLTKNEMLELFPGCTIEREKMLGMTKSYSAVVTTATPAS
jgi:SAM-dependent methyltransferase